MKIDNIDKINTQEKLQAMETIWRSLLDENEAIESPEWHSDILNERKAKIDSGEARFISLSDFKKIKF